MGKYETITKYLKLYDEAYCKKKIWIVCEHLENNLIYKPWKVFRILGSYYFVQEQLNKIYMKIYIGLMALCSGKYILCAAWFLGSGYNQVDKQ